MKKEEALLSLTRLGIGHSAYLIPEIIDWASLQDFADRQGLYALALDGIERMPESKRPSQEMLLQWIGEVLQGYEYRYERHRLRLT